MLFREYYALTRHSLSSVNASTYRYSWASIDTTSPVCWVNTVPHPLSAGRLFHIRHYTSFLVIPNSFTSKLVKSWNWIYCLISFNSAKLTVNGASGFELFVWWMLMVRHAHNSHQSMVNKMKHTLGINKNANRLPSVCVCVRALNSSHLVDENWKQGVDVSYHHWFILHRWSEKQCESKSEKKTHRVLM